MMITGHAPRVPSFQPPFLRQPIPGPDPAVGCQRFSCLSRRLGIGVVLWPAPVPVPDDECVVKLLDLGPLAPSSEARKAYASDPSHTAKNRLVLISTQQRKPHHEYYADSLIAGCAGFQEEDTSRSPLTDAASEGTCSSSKGP